MRIETHVVSAVNGEIEQGQKIFPQHLEKSAVLAAHAGAEGSVLGKPADRLDRGPPQHLVGGHEVHGAGDVQPVHLVRAVHELDPRVDCRDL